MNSQLTPLGVLIRTLRQNKGTTLYRMAKAIDLSPAQICAIEFGRTELTDAKAVLIADFICRVSQVSTHSHPKQLKSTTALHVTAANANPDFGRSRL